MRQILFIVLVGMAVVPAWGQQPTGGEWAWKPIIKHEGVAIQYIFYREADGENNGVVVMLVNENDYAVGYRFKIIFRSDGGGEVVEPVSGDLGPKEARTGDADGLFWIPFPDGRAISEVGLRGYKITPKPRKTSD